MRYLMLPVFKLGLGSFFVTVLTSFDKGVQGPSYVSQKTPWGFQWCARANLST